MVPTYTRRPGGKMYRYYIPIEALKKLPEDSPVHRIPAGELEETVVAQMRRHRDAVTCVADAVEDVLERARDADDRQEVERKRDRPAPTMRDAHVA